MSKLIAEVAKRDAYVVVILDSCHSGSGTRNFDAVTVRRVPTDPRRWVIDAGSMHGIPPPKGEETTWLAVFPFDVASLVDLSASIGEARVLKTQPRRSLVELSMADGKPADAALTYKAVVMALPVAPLEFSLEGEAASAARVRNALGTASAAGKPSLFVRESSDSPQMRVIAGAGGFRIMRVADDRALVVDVADTSDAAAHRVVERLEHIARWSQIATLTNPTSKLAPDSVRLDLYAVGGDGALTPLQPAVSSSGLRLQYQLRDGEWHEPLFKIELTNTSGRRLYCMLLNLTETYKVWPCLLPGGGIWLDPGERTWAFDGEAIFAAVPEELWQQSLTEIKDILKLAWHE